MLKSCKGPIQNLLIVGLGLALGFLLTETIKPLQLVTVPHRIVTMLYTVACLFGSILSFYFAYKILRSGKPLLIPSFVVAAVFVFPVCGLLIGRYLTTGQAPYLYLALSPLFLLWHERWNASLVGAPLRYAGHTLRSVLDAKGLKYSEFNHLFLVRTTEDTALRLGNYLTTAHFNVEEKAGVALLNEILPSLKNKVAERPLPRFALSWGRHLFWGCLCLTIVSYAAARTPW